MNFRRVFWKYSDGFVIGRKDGANLEVSNKKMKDLNYGYNNGILNGVKKLDSMKQCDQQHL